MVGLLGDSNTHQDGHYKAQDDRYKAQAAEVSHKQKQSEKSSS